MASQNENITTDIKMELDTPDDQHKPQDTLNHHQPENPLDHHPQTIDLLDHPEDPVHQPKNALEQMVSQNTDLDDKKNIIYKNAKHVRLTERVDDTHSKLFIAKSILQACKHEADNEQNNRMMGIDKLHHYTKQPLDYLNKVIKEDKSGIRSFKQAIIDTKPLPPTILPFIYSDVRDIFIEYYVEKKQLPTETLFLQSLHSKRENSFYGRVKLRTLVKNNLVNYHYLPKLSRVILSENPEFAYQRHLYLRQIMNFRSSLKNIVYVAVMKVQNFTEKCVSFLALAASSTAGLICKCDNVKYVEYHDVIVGNDQIKAWIQYELLPKIAPSSVVVLTQERKNDTTPTPFSSNNEMKKWLQKREVPFDFDSHKAQLFNLVKLFQKKNKDKGFYGEVLASSGFQVIICPNEYESLDFFRDIYTNTDMTGDASTLQSIVEFVQKLSQDEWAEIEARIIAEEKRMMSDDSEMQRIVDNLLDMVKEGDAKETDFPEGCRATKVDNYDVHIGDIIVD